VIIVEKFRFEEICGDLRDSNNPNYAQLGMCRASRLEGIADAMMLRKLFVAWGNEARDAQVVTKLGGGLQPRQKPNGELHEDGGDTFGGVQRVCGKPACNSSDALMSWSQPEPQDDGNDSERDYAASKNNQLAIGAGFRFSLVTRDCWALAAAGGV
jgi:hypothetical protein